MSQSKGVNAHFPDIQSIKENTNEAGYGSDQYSQSSVPVEPWIN